MYNLLDQNFYYRKYILKKMALKIKTAITGWRGGHSDRNNAKDDLSRLREWRGGLFKQSKDYFKFTRLFLIAPLWLFSHPLNNFLNSGSVHCPVHRTGVPGDDEKKVLSWEKLWKLSNLRWPTWSSSRRTGSRTTASWRRWTIKKFSTHRRSLATSSPCSPRKSFRKRWTVSLLYEGLFKFYELEKSLT